MLELKGLSAYYGRAIALGGVDLAVPAGGVTAVVGPNGAGKSTLLKAVMGLVLREGKVLYDGQDLSKLEPEAIAALGLGLVPEGGRVFGEMDVLDNLKVGAHLVTDPVRRRASLERVYALFPRLAERAGQKAHTLSGGERQMLALGRALMAEPKLLLLDEPSLGLHPINTTRLFQAIQAIGAQGVTILLVEQKVRLALEMAQRAYVLERGRVVKKGPGPELLNDPEVRRAYLGC